MVCVLSGSTVSLQRVLCLNRGPAGEEEEGARQQPSSVLLGLNFSCTWIDLRRSLPCCMPSSVDVLLGEVEGDEL